MDGGMNFDQSSDFTHLQIIMRSFPNSLEDRIHPRKRYTGIILQKYMM